MATQAKLRTAIDKQHIVRVERKPKHADRLDGFMVLVGEQWALMARTSDGGFFNGFVAFRIRDVTRIKKDRTFETEFAKTRPEWPPAYPHDIDLGTTADVIEGMSLGAVLMGLQKENERSAIWIGKFDEIIKRWVYLLEVHPDASWYDKPLGYKLKAITSVEIGSQY
ncbi:MAG TPA: hypothetical protein VK537_01360, partial [Galbitalea sp.]|nr:hypothetical protein [Galbitalea sp.]